MKRLVICTLLFFPFMVIAYTAHALEKGSVVKRFSGCDYFIADGPRGLYVLEWYGGYDPDEGDILIGDIGSYGFADVYYLEKDQKGRVYVEDFLESADGAYEEIVDHC